MTTRLDTDPDWKKLLSDTAVAVHELICHEENLREWHERVNGIVERWSSHVDSCERHSQQRLEHWRQIKNHPEWRIEKRDPPREGWEWDKWYLFDVPRTSEGFICIEGKYFPDDQAHSMPIAYAEGFQWLVGGYIDRNNEKLKRFDERTTEYQSLSDTIAKQTQHIKVIQAQLDKLTFDCVSPPLLRAPGQWWKYLEIPDDEIFGCWHPPMGKVSANPVDRFLPPKGEKHLPPPFNEAEEYERYYVILASIHDNLLPASKSITGNLWPTKLAKQVWGRLSWGQPNGPDEPFIKVALESVTQELRNPPPLLIQPTVNSHEIPSAEIDVLQDTVANLRRFMRSAPSHQFFTFEPLLQHQMELTHCFPNWAYVMRQLEESGLKVPASSLKERHLDVMLCMRVAIDAAKNTRGKVMWPNNLGLKIENLIRQINAVVSSVEGNPNEAEHTPDIPGLISQQPEVLKPEADVLVSVPDLSRPPDGVSEDKEKGSSSTPGRSAEAQDDTGSRKGPMSKPLPMTKWALVFGVSRSTIGRWKDEGTYHFESVSAKKWKLPLNELPAEYLQKYTQNTSNT